MFVYTELIEEIARARKVNLADLFKIYPLQQVEVRG